ncbi:hypothetical protein, partial [Methanothrix sp.]|uniref:hypothetical protein n=1 Tax=Methanothrix sp. TaxID=90426 RepID=UPI0034E21371
IPALDPGIYTRCRDWTRGIYHWLVSRRWFVNAVIAFFIIQSVVTLFEAALLVMIKLADSFLHLSLISISMASWLEILAAAISSILVLSGVLMIRRNRLAAYYRFKNAMLVQILLVQTFAFYRDQLSALTALGVNIMIFLTLRYMIDQESSNDREIC